MLIASVQQQRICHLFGSYGFRISAE